jgi:hypothetical protein
LCLICVFCCLFGLSVAIFVVDSVLFFLSWFPFSCYSSLHCWFFVICFWFLSLMLILYSFMRFLSYSIFVVSFVFDCAFVCYLFLRYLGFQLFVRCVFDFFFFAILLQKASWLFRLFIFTEIHTRYVSIFYLNIETKKTIFFPTYAASIVFFLISGEALSRTLNFCLIHLFYSTNLYLKNSTAFYCVFLTHFYSRCICM